MKKILTAILFILINVNINQVYSQSNLTNEDASLVVTKKEILNNKLGFAASMISGYGLSYEYNLSPAYTLEFTGSIYGEGGKKNSNNISSSYLVSTLGLELQKNMFVNSDSRFYILTSASLWIDNNTNPNNYYAINSITTQDNQTSFVAGLGLGWEINIAKRIIMNLEGGYSYKSYKYYGTDLAYDNINNIYSSIDYNRSAYRFGFGVACGIYYAF